MSTGSLFNYFATKAAMLNGLYLFLKTDLAASVWSTPFPAGTLEVRAFEAWSRWTRWGADAPEKQQALTILETTPEITTETREAGQTALQGLGELFAETHSIGPLAQQPLEFVVGLVAALALTTMQFMAATPERGDDCMRAGFTAAWSVAAGPRKREQWPLAVRQRHLMRRNGL